MQMRDRREAEDETEPTKTAGHGIVGVDHILALGDASASLGLINTLVFGMGISFMFELPLTGSWLNVFEFMCVVLASACSAFVLSFALLEYYYVCEALWGSRTNGAAGSAAHT